MYKIGYTNRFKKDLKRCIKRGYKIELLEKTIDTLKHKGCLPQSYKPHKLTGKYADGWECHIQPDCLLIWQQNEEELFFLCLNTGTHSDLF